MKFQTAWRLRLGRYPSTDTGGVWGSPLRCFSESERVGGVCLGGSFVAWCRVHTGTHLLWSLVLCRFGEACLVSLHLVAVALRGRGFGR